MTKSVEDLTNDEKAAAIRAAMGTQQERDEQREQTYRKNNPPAEAGQNGQQGGEPDDRVEALDSLVNEADAQAGAEAEGERDRYFKAVAAIRKAHAKPDFEAARKAELEQGEGLDLGIHFYLRKADSTDYFKYNESGGEGEPLLFKGVNYLAARTGGGKTRCECALAALTLFKYRKEPKPKRVIFFSLEEPAKDIQKHIVTAFINLEHDTLKNTEDEITEADTTAALLGKLTDSTKQSRIEDGYSDLADLLTVIDSTTFDDAKDKAIEGNKDLNKDTVSAILADVAADIEAIILDAVAEYGAENVVFFIDYAQMIRDPEGAKSAASYKELKAVAQHLKNTAQRNAVLFVGAQVDRSAIKMANAKEFPRPHEFHTMTREDLREAADLEQSGSRIIYLTIDDKSMVDDHANPLPYLNMRLLKNRLGTEHLYASAPIHFGRWIIDFSQLTAPTFGDKGGLHGALIETTPSGKTVETVKTTAPAEQPAPSAESVQTKIFTDEAGETYEAAASYAEAYYGPMGGATAGNSAPQKPFKPTRRKI